MSDSGGGDGARLLLEDGWGRDSSKGVVEVEEGSSAEEKEFNSWPSRAGSEMDATNLVPNRYPRPQPFHLLVLVVLE